jgi:quercetin 2,3-dioxygenase
MQIEFQSASERGLTEKSWLKSYHLFSFGSYFDLQRLNFGTLRVFNDDTVAPGKGFAPHAHDNMEIVTIVLEGALEHKDTLGNQGILNAGDVQRMSAGKGVEHSEMNPSGDEKVRFLQIWVYPARRDIGPDYEQKHFYLEQFPNKLLPIVASLPSETALYIHQDAQFFLGQFDENQSITHTTSKRRGILLYVIDGKVALGEKILAAGDSAKITQIEKLELLTQEPSKLLLIEVNMVML